MFELGQSWSDQTVGLDDHFMPLPVFDSVLFYWNFLFYPILIYPANLEGSFGFLVFFSLWFSSDHFSCFKVNLLQCYSLSVS